MDNTETLHQLLIRACPPHDRKRGENGKWVYFQSEEGKFKSIILLAKLLKMSAWGVQKWCKDQHIPPKRAAAIVDLNPAEVTLADFGRFIYM